MLCECFAFMRGHEVLLGGVVGGREEGGAVEAAGGRRHSQKLLHNFSGSMDEHAYR